MALLSLPPRPLLSLAPFNFGLYGIADEIRQLLAGSGVEDGSNPRQGARQNTGLVLYFAFRPISTSRRMAAARDGLSGCFDRHLSTDFRNSFDARI